MLLSCYFDWALIWDVGPVADTLPPSGQEVRPSVVYTELVDMLTHAPEKLNIERPVKPSDSPPLQAILSDQSNSLPIRRKLPFLSNLHYEI